MSDVTKGRISPDVAASRVAAGLAARRKEKRFQLWQDCHWHCASLPGYAFCLNFFQGYSWFFPALCDA